VGIGMSAMACGGEDGGGTQPPSPPQTPGGGTGTPGGEPGAGGETSTPTPAPSPLPTDTPTPTPCPTPELDNDLFRITNEEVDGAGGMLNYLQAEDEALLLARVGIGEGADGNHLDQELVMWTVKARSVIGVSNDGTSPSTIKQEILHSQPTGEYDYSAIGGLIALTYPSGISECGNNIRRMGYPCDESLEQIRTAYARAQIIVASSLADMPSGDPVDLRGFDSFTAPWAGSPGQWCVYGDIPVEGVTRPAEKLAGATVFFDCWVADNYQLGFPTPTPE